MIAAPRGARRPARFLVMFFHAIVRIEQNFFLASAVAAWFALFKCSPSAAQALPPLPRHTQRLLRRV